MVSDEYLAGFFDGDGCVSARCKHKSGQAAQVVVYITNTYRPILEEFARQFGGTVSTRASTATGRKPVHYWCLTGASNIGTLLLRLEPHLIEKRGQAKLALDIIYSQLDMARTDVRAKVIQLSSAKHR